MGSLKVRQFRVKFARVPRRVAVLARGFFSTIAGTLVLTSVALAGPTSPKLPAFIPDIPWAFYLPSKLQPSLHERTGPLHIPGSSRSYTQAQIDNLMQAPDWFPDEHPPMPPVVSRGAPGGVCACATCHLASGLGHPESSSLAGLSQAYIEHQLRDFKTGRRLALAMPQIAKNMSDTDIRAAAFWFSQLPARPWQTVVETDRVPKTFVDRHLWRLPLPDAGDEPIGSRIIEVPQDIPLAESRDPHSGFIAYVPKGSVEKGRNLVTTGGDGKTFQCGICHGPALGGLGEVPLIGGHDPIYLFRQLYYFKHGLRNGSLSPLMQQVVANLSQNDMLDIAAYLGSLPPHTHTGEASRTPNR